MSLSIPDPVLVATMAGIFGMAGGYVGARLSRRSEYQKWLRQERNIAFAQFLLRIKEFQNQALDVVLSREGEELERGLRLSELKMRFETDENLVRLYLTEDDRENFSAALRDLRNAYDPIIKQAKRLDTSDKVGKVVRELFERVLHTDD